MKYLITITSRIGQGSPKPTDPNASFAAAQEWNRKKIEQGVFDCVYSFTNARGGIVIVNANSHEEVMRIIVTAPMFHYMDYEVTPLCDTQKFWQGHIDMIKKPTGDGNTTPN